MFEWFKIRKIKNEISKATEEQKIKMAENGDARYQDILVNDPAEKVRAAVAEFGNDDHRKILINDAEVSVRMNVAQYGNDSHRDALIKDEAWEVRMWVASSGNDNHRAVLVHDKDEYVRGEVARFGNKDNLRELENDKTNRVKQGIHDNVVEYRKESTRALEAQLQNSSDISLSDMAEESIKSVGASNATNKMEGMLIAGVKKHIAGLDNEEAKKVRERMGEVDFHYIAERAVLAKKDELTIQNGLKMTQPKHEMQ